MAQIEIVIDDREQKVIPFFNGYAMPPNITFNVARINHGDYSIIYKNHILFVIERKTWTDLASSLRDGRKENNKKLLKIREETKCQLIYLIEGNPIPSSNKVFSRVPYKALRSHLDHLAFRDGMHMVYSKDTEHTVERIVELVKNYLTITPSPLIALDIKDTEEKRNADIKKDTDRGNTDDSKKDGGESYKSGETPEPLEPHIEILKEKTPIEILKEKTPIEILKEKVPISDDVVIYKIWCCVPNITEKTACLFINKGYHISDLILGKISKNEIYSTKYSNGYIIGNKRSEVIWNSTRIVKTHINPIFIKMLTQVNGITKITALAILNVISFEKLLNGDISIKELSEIKKSQAGRKLGVKAASDLIKWFSKSNSGGVDGTVSVIDDSASISDVSTGFGDSI
jgi:ERCC4-type nuclease